jgi:hypothetical protein
MWAVDYDNESETNGCKTGFATKAEADAYLLARRATVNFADADVDLGANARVRRCRSATIDDFGLEVDLDWLLETWEDDGMEPSSNGDVFGRWDDSMLDVASGGIRLVADVMRRAVTTSAWVLYDEPSEQDRIAEIWWDGPGSEAAIASRREGVETLWAENSRLRAEAEHLRAERDAAQAEVERLEKTVATMRYDDERICEKALDHVCGECHGCLLRESPDAFEDGAS